MKKALFLAAGMLASGLFATAANAAPLGNIAKDVVTTDIGLLQQVHNGQHSSCQFGTRGWHYNNRRGTRVECRPARPAFRYWVWRSEGGRSDWYHSRDRRWR